MPPHCPAQRYACLSLAPLSFVLNHPPACCGGADVICDGIPLSSLLTPPCSTVFLRHQPSHRRPSRTTARTHCPSNPTTMAAAARTTATPSPRPTAPSRSWPSPSCWIDASLRRNSSPGSSHHPLPLPRALTPTTSWYDANMIARYSVVSSQLVSLPVETIRLT